MKFYLLALVMTLACMLSAGCGGSKKGTGSSDGSGSDVEQVDGEASGSIKRRDRETLPAVDAYLPPLDGGRLRVAPPKGWNLVAREKYLVRFVQGDEASLPRIAISGEDSPSPEISAVSEDNVGELVELLEAKSKEGKRKPVEPLRPIILGDRVFVRYVRMARYKDEPCAIVSLQTVQDNRLYTIELFVKAGSDGSEYAKYLKQSQEAAYAVAANMLFGDEPEPAASPKSEPEKPAEEKPAEAAPAESP